MHLYFPAIAIAFLLAVGIFAHYFAKRRSVDVEVDSLKRSRKIWVPDDTYHMSIFDLHLCVSCEGVHTTGTCPRCGSEMVIPLKRIVQSTTALELPVKRSTTPDNVIPLPIARSF